MPPRGRAPLPNNVKRLRGVRPSRMNAGEVEVPPGSPAAPPWLTGAARPEFDRLLVECGPVLTPVDGTAVALLAEALVDVQTWRALVRAEPIVWEEGRGRRNPAAIALGAASNHAAALATSLGMTPAARTRLLAVEPPREPSPADRFLLNPRG